MTASLPPALFARLTLVKDVAEGAFALFDPARHASDLLQARSRLLERRVDHRQDLREVRAARDLGHDPAVGGVQAGLAVDHRGEDLPPVADDRGRGFVAGGLDAQDQDAHRR